MVQKYHDSLKKIKAQLHILRYKDKDGTGSDHIQSEYEFEEQLQVAAHAL